MLAERKRKPEYILNPRKPYWTEDANSFGQQMLKKMGWEPGKGLGANEQGMTDIVKVKYKTDNKCIGYKEREEQWTEQQEQFGNLLQYLKLSHDEISSEKKGNESLEQRSCRSKVRVHYKKFTQGKDLTNYSAKDLNCIFGSKSNADEVDNSNMDIVTANRGSMSNFNKLIKDSKIRDDEEKKRRKRKFENVLQEESNSVSRNGEILNEVDDSSSKKKKKKKKKEKKKEKEKKKRKLETPDKTCIDRESEIKRVIDTLTRKLFKKKERSQLSCYMNGGENSENFSYLDEQISDKLLDGDHEKKKNNDVIHLEQNSSHDLVENDKKNTKSNINREPLDAEGTPKKKKEKNKSLIGNKKKEIKSSCGKKKRNKKHVHNVPIEYRTCSNEMKNKSPEEMELYNEKHCTECKLQRQNSYKIGVMKSSEFGKLVNLSDITFTGSNLSYIVGYGKSKRYSCNYELEEAVNLESASKLNCTEGNMQVL